MVGGGGRGAGGLGSIEAADLPPGMIASCPMKNALVRVASVCFGCEHFGGIGRLNPDERLAWNARHVVLCKYRRKIPIHRLDD